MQIKTALKEWSVAVDAIAQGETLLLLRKGGIQEQQGRFVAEAKQVALMPTFEHQRHLLLKPQYRAAVEPVAPGWHPPTLTLKAWAEITHIFMTDDAEQVAALAAFHIWQPQLAQARLNWKPKQPLYVLALRAYRWIEPVTLPWDAAYGGCRSWVTLSEGIETGDGLSEVAIADAEYSAQIAAIEAVLAD
jgi:hypothetical protein